MTINIEALLPSSIALGSGTISTLPNHLRYNDRVLIVATRHLRVDESIAGTAAEVEILRWSGEPDIHALERAAHDYSDFDPTIVAGIGGGSVLDAAKALAAAIPNRTTPLIDHLEVVGAGLPLFHGPLRVIAVPTTAGTGSEMTKNAVIDVPAARRKVSLRDPRLVPLAVIIDPDLAAGLPQRVASACALDATVQLVESYATPFANYISDLWALGGAERGLDTARRVIGGAADIDTRLEMGIAAMCSGAALASSKLGTIHGFAGVVGGATGMGHGRLCGLFAAPVLRRTIQRLESTDAAHQSLQRYSRLADMAGLVSKDPMALADWFGQLADQADIDPGPIAALTEAARRDVVTATANASSTKGNPARLDTDDLGEILDGVASA